MSLAFSITPDEMTRRLAQIGIACQFAIAPQPFEPPSEIVTNPNRFFSFPVPEDNSALTLANIKRAVGSDPKRQPCIFDHEWYATESFMDEPCRPGWRVLSMDVIPESIDRPWGGPWPLPSAVEVVLMLFLHYIGTGEQLLIRKHTWCRDTASLGRYVTVGAFGRNGVFLSAHPPSYSSRGLGVCWAGN
jgi:hypothetical protein